MNKFMGNGVKKLDMGGMYSNESKPASVPNTDKQRVDKSFTAIDSNGPWIVNDAKSGNSGATKDWGKINSLANDHSAIVDAGK